jgi:hypothetical protein
MLKRYLCVDLEARPRIVEGITVLSFKAIHRRIKRRQAGALQRRG